MVQYDPTRPSPCLTIFVANALIRIGASSPETSLIRSGVRTERVGMRHGDDIVAAIDKMNLAGDAGREVREQVESGAAQLVERHAAMQRRMALLEGEHET